MSPARRWRRRGLAFSAVIALCALWLPIAGPQASADVPSGITFDPNTPQSFEPFTVTISASGCPPGGPASVEIARHNHDARSDVGGNSDLYPVAEPSAIADVSGDVQLSATFPIAYPGHWRAFGLCGGPASPVGCTQEWDVDAPGWFAVSIAPSSAPFDQPTDLLLSGVGCLGTDVFWSSAAVPVAWWTEGAAVPDEAGDWSGSSSAFFNGDSRILRTDDSAIVSVACRHADGALVYYPRLHLGLYDVPATTVPASKARAGVVEPRFTG